MTRGDEPQVVVADSTATLDRVLALELVAQTEPAEIQDPVALDAIRTALLDEQWGTALAEWIGVMDEPVDVWTDRVMWTHEMIDEELLGFEFQFAPVFRA